MEAPLQLQLNESRWNNNQLTDLGFLGHADQPIFAPWLKEESQLVFSIEGEDPVRQLDWRRMIQLMMESHIQVNNLG